MQEALIERIEAIIAPTLNHMGYEVVRIQWRDGQKRRTLQIMADRTDGTEINVDDCAEISHTVSALLDVDDPITGAYDLEVSSPGIDRPLVKQKDFAEYQGYEIKAELQRPVNGRRRFRGILEGISEEGIIELSVDGEIHALPWRDVQSAKLVLNDALMERALAKQQEIQQ